MTITHVIKMRCDFGCACLARFFNAYVSKSAYALQLTRHIGSDNEKRCWAYGVCVGVVVRVCECIFGGHRLAHASFAIGMQIALVKMCENMRVLEDMRATSMNDVRPA